MDPIKYKKNLLLFLANPKKLSTHKFKKPEPKKEVKEVNDDEIKYDKEEPKYEEPDKLRKDVYTKRSDFKQEYNDDDNTYKEAKHIKRELKYDDEKSRKYDDDDYRESKRDDFKRESNNDDNIFKESNKRDDDEPPRRKKEVFDDVPKSRNQLKCELFFRNKTFFDDDEPRQETRMIVNGLTEIDLEMLDKAKQFRKDGEPIPEYNYNSNMQEVYADVHRIEDKRGKLAHIKKKKSDMAAQVNFVTGITEIFPNMGLNIDDAKIKDIINQQDDFFGKQYDSMTLEQRKKRQVKSELDIWKSIGWSVVQNIEIADFVHGISRPKQINSDGFWQNLQKFIRRIGNNTKPSTPTIQVSEDDVFTRKMMEPLTPVKVKITPLKVTPPKETTLTLYDINDVEPPPPVI